MVTVLPSCSKATAHPPTFLAQDFSLPLRAGSILSRNHQGGYMRDRGANCPRDQGRGRPWGAQDHFSQEVSAFRLEESGTHPGAPPPTAPHGPEVSPQGKKGQLWPLEGRRCPRMLLDGECHHHHPPPPPRGRAGRGVDVGWWGRKDRRGGGTEGTRGPGGDGRPPPLKAKVTSSEQTGW